MSIDTRCTIFRQVISAPFPRRRFVQMLAATLAAGFLPTRASAATLDESEVKNVLTSAPKARWQGPSTHGSGWLEWRLDAPSAWSALRKNPFDANVADIQVTFIGPNAQRILATAFWTKDDRGTGWAVRLLPPVAGNWQMSATIRAGGSTLTAVASPQDFVVASAPSRQHIGIDSTSPNYFAFDDGSPYIPVGLNIGWSVKSPLDDYERWFKRLAENGGNFARLWMASWSFGLEWSDTGLGNYNARMPRAEQLDEVLLLAEKYGIKVMLCMVNHGAFAEGTDSEWKNNPYNKVNGGPLSQPTQFVTHPLAKELFARRLRYTAARWAHSPAIHSWEWWNEINWTKIPDEDVMPWIREMSLVLARHDPYKRLRTTSGHDASSKVWAMPEIDFAQQHDYTETDLNLYYAGRYREFRAEVPTKPLLPAELGYGTNYDSSTKLPFNWDSVHLHNGLWAPIFFGYAGTGMYWWWDLMVDPTNQWPAYKGITRYLAAVNSGQRLASYKPRKAAIIGGEATVMAMQSQNSVLVWVRADLQDVSALKELYADSDESLKPDAAWTPEWPRISGARLRIGGLSPSIATASARWIDAQSGEWLPVTSKAAVTAGELDLICPDFNRDLAAIISLHEKGA